MRHVMMPGLVFFFWKWLGIWWSVSGWREKSSFLCHVRQGLNLSKNYSYKMLQRRNSWASVLLDVSSSSFIFSLWLGKCNEPARVLLSSAWHFSTENYFFIFYASPLQENIILMMMKWLVQKVKYDHVSSRLWRWEWYKIHKFSCHFFFYQFRCWEKSEEDGEG